MLTCKTCNTPLVGRQTKFCSAICKGKFTNTKHQNYATQQKRGQDRKIALLEMKGSCCELCGYKKNLSALCFHHINPATKSFQIDIRKCSNSSWQQLVIEAEKCQLLCLNCHAEVHNPIYNT